MQCCVIKSIVAFFWNYDQEPNSGILFTLSGKPLTTEQAMSFSVQEDNEGGGNILSIKQGAVLKFCLF